MLSCRVQRVALRAQKFQQLRFALSQDEQAFVQSLSIGMQVSPTLFGTARMPHDVKQLLARRGLSRCSLSQRIYSLEDMKTRCHSFDGKRRYQIMNGAILRARHQSLCFDKALLHNVAFGRLPLDFAGVPYYAPTGGSAQKGPRKMSLTIDQIVAGKGYIRGNIRFLPFWVNCALQRFSDQKAYRIAERLAGVRPTLPADLITSELYVDARRIVANARSNAVGRRVLLSPCFTFDRHLVDGKLVRKCVYSGMPLQYGGKSPDAHGHSASFDRIDPTAGYTCANVQVVANSVNALKGDMSSSQNGYG